MQHKIVTMFSVSCAFIGMIAARSIAQPSAEVCASNGGPEICVRFDNVGTPPQINTEFTFDLVTDPGNPSVDLLQGRDSGSGLLFQWRVWSRVSSSDTTPANIGVIKALASDDFSVTIRNPSDKGGAQDVGAINLNPPGSNHSSIMKDGLILGDIGGDLTITSGAGLGSSEFLQVNGTVTGDVTVPFVKKLQLLSSTFGTVTIGVIFPNGFLRFLSGPVSCPVSGGWTGDSVFGPVTIATMLDSSKLWIVGHLQNDLTIGSATKAEIIQWGHVGNNAEGGGVLPVNVTIADMDGAPLTLTNARFGFHATAGAACEFHAGLDLQNGIPINTRVHVFGELSSNASIDLNNKDVAGWLRHCGGGTGSIRNGGTVTGHGLVILGDGWTGTATFASVDAAKSADEGIIRSEDGGDIDGTATITGAMNGTVSATVDLNGTIDINGDCNGTVSVLGSSNGIVDIAGSLRGDIHMANDLNGSVSVTGVVNGDIDIDGDVTSTGSVHLASTLRAGRVLVDGLLDGPVTIDDATGQLSQINLLGGVGPGGQVVINAAGGDWHADGDIWVGATITLPPLSPIDFDGCIQINDNGAIPPGFGNLNGDITVVGCHDIGDTVPVCVEGMTNGTITLIQSLCTNQATLDTGCPACP